MIMQVGNSSNALGRLSFGRIEELKRQRPFLRFVVVIVIVIIVKRQLSPPQGQHPPTHPPPLHFFIPFMNVHIVTKLDPKVVPCIHLEI